MRPNRRTITAQGAPPSATRTGRGLKGRRLTAQGESLGSQEESLDSQGESERPERPQAHSPGRIPGFPGRISGFPGRIPGFPGRIPGFPVRDTRRCVPRRRSPPVPAQSSNRCGRWSYVLRADVPPRRFERRRPAQISAAPRIAPANRPEVAKALRRACRHQSRTARVPEGARRRAPSGFCARAAGTLLNLRSRSLRIAAWNPSAMPSCRPSCRPSSRASLSILVT